MNENRKAAIQLASGHHGNIFTSEDINFAKQRNIAFSYVHLVKQGKQYYALKRMRLQLRDQEEAFDREVAAHRAVNHPNVLSLYDVEVVTKSGYREGRMLLSYYKDGTVQDLIEKTVGYGNPAPESDLLRIFRSTCEAVSAFHNNSPPLAHRDIKPHNILLGSNYNVILFDLGSVCEARCSIRSRREALALQERCAQECTAAYRAPELFEVPSHCEIDEKTDIWSLGCTLYAMAYGDSPCDGSALSALSGNIRIPCNSSYSTDFNILIQSILQVDPQERLSIPEILRIIDSLCPSQAEFTYANHKDISIQAV